MTAVSGWIPVSKRKTSNRACVQVNAWSLLTFWYLWERRQILNQTKLFVCAPTPVYMGCLNIKKIQFRLTIIIFGNPKCLWLPILHCTNNPIGFYCIITHFKCIIFDGSARRYGASYKHVLTLPVHNTFFRKIACHTLSRVPRGYLIAFIKYSF